MGIWHRLPHEPARGHLARPPLGQSGLAGPASFARRMAALLVLPLLVGGCAAQMAPLGGDASASGAVSTGSSANEVADVGLAAPMPAAATPAWQVGWVSPSVQLTGLAVFGPTEAWVTGSDGMLYTWDGTGWHAQRVDDDIALLAAVDARHAWVASDDGIRYWNGAAWRLTSTDGTVTALAAVDTHHAWAASSRGISAWDGTGWQLTPGGRGAIVHGFAPISETRAWAVGALPDGQGVVFSWDGAAWRIQATVPDPLTAVYTSDPLHAWAVGCRGAVYAWNGQTWQVTTDLHLPLTDVAGTDATHVWVTAANGEIWKLDDGNWSVAYRAPTTVAAVSPLDAGNVWAIGFDTVYSTDAALGAVSTGSGGFSSGL